MVNGERTKAEDLQIQGLIDRYLKLKVSASGLTVEGQHLDEDMLTAFVEGNLARRENQPIIGHLIECTFCRHKTAELVKLEMSFADDEVEFTANEKQPSKVSEVLNGLLTRIFGSSEEAVFAHQEKEETEVSEAATD